MAHPKERTEWVRRNSLPGTLNWGVSALLPLSTGPCPASSALSLLDSRLKPNSTPLSVYWSTKFACVRLITADEIERFMRHLASKVYLLHPGRDSSDLSKWSSHSLRVGACVALHAMGFSPMDIQWILRWRSQAFMAYLRNIAILAHRQVQALDRAAALPFPLIFFGNHEFFEPNFLFPGCALWPPFFLYGAFLAL